MNAFLSRPYAIAILFPRSGLAVAIGALGAAQAHKAVRQNAALGKGLELVFDKPQQARPSLRFDLGEKGCELFLHQRCQREVNATLQDLTLFR